MTIDDNAQHSSFDIVDTWIHDLIFTSGHKIKNHPPIIAEISTSDRRTDTWSNGGNRDRAIWQHRYPDFIRVRVLSPGDTEIFNRLLQRQADGC